MGYFNVTVIRGEANKNSNMGQELENDVYHDSQTIKYYSINTR